MAIVVRVIAVLVLSLAIASCGGQTEAGPATQSFTATPAVSGEAGPVPIPLPQLQPRSVSLQAALTDLAEMPVPPEVDGALFETLRDELEIALVKFYGADGGSQQWSKAASAIDPISLNGAWCLDGKLMPTGQVTINWRGQHLGDYDLNSEVNVADITQLVIHYQANPERDVEGLPVVDGVNEREAQTDGDENGEVNVADITQIALNYASSVVGYRLYPGTSTDGTTFTWDADFVPNADNPGAAFTMPFNTSLEAGEIFRYSATFEYTPAPGVALYVKVVPFDGNSEGPEQIIPVPEGPHAIFECSKCHFVTSLDFLGPEDSCHNCHSAPPEDRQTSWADTPGVHSNCMLCHGEHGFSITPADSICINCHSSVVTEVTAAGMPACLTCHDNAHLPAAPATSKCADCHSSQATQIAAGTMTDCDMCHDQHSFGITYTAATCTGCHTAPPDVSGGDWASAPGMHGACESCHTGHDFAIAEPNSVCSTCHQAKIDEGHAGGGLDCLACHASPHIPETAVTGLNCTECHLTPPENPEALWEDAPGDHGNCVLCHNQPEHSYKPTPPESVCSNCHQDKIDAGHAGGSTECMACHNFPHLPVLPTPPQDLHDAHPLDIAGCTDCHPHGGMPLRGTCVECHDDKVDHYPPDTCQTCHSG